MTTVFARVGDLAQQIRGVTYSKSEAASAPAPGFLPVLRAGNITEHGLRFTDLVFVPEARVNARQRIRRNDVLIAASSGSLEVVGKAGRALQDFDGGFGAFCKVLRPSERVDPGYFAHFFKTVNYRRTISSLAAGANINNLRSQHLDDLQIPLPPLVEQRRIAAILDQADALRAKRRQALAQLGCVTDSIVADLLRTIQHEGYPHRALRDIAERVMVGHVGPTTEFFCDDGVPFLRTGNIGSLQIDTSDLKRITPAFHQRLTKSTLRKGDVLVSRVISSEVRCAVVPAELDGANCANVIIIRPGSEISSRLLANLIRTPASQQALLGQRVGSAQSVVNTKVLQSWLVPVLPAAVQVEASSRFVAVEDMQVKQEACLTALDRLFRSLQSRAFAGEL